MTKNNDKKIDYLKVIFLKIQKGSSEVVKYHVSNAIQIFFIEKRDNMKM